MVGGSFLVPGAFTMFRSTALLILACSLGAGLGAQQGGAPAIAEQARAVETFYRAFYLDRGEGQRAQAHRLYVESLELAPNHAHASDAARYALNLLRQLRRSADATRFERRYAKLLGVSAKPGINSGYLDPKINVQRMVQRFEGESREVYRHRKKLADLVGLKPGQAVADIGAGTGIFTWPFARIVGSTGTVYAVDIAPKLVERLGRVAKTGKLSQVKPVLCGEKTCGLAKNSVDAIFICDTYHHFEFPQDTLKTIYDALRPGAQLVLIDFERIPGKSRNFILGHVRAPKEVFRKEIESSGLRFVEEVKTPLKENYFLRFRKPR